MKGICRQKYFSRDKLLAYTGLLLSLFLLHHILAIGLMFISPKTLNLFAYHLNQGPFIYVLEGVLVASLLIHLVSVESRKRSLSSPQWFSGVLILFLTVLHLFHMKTNLNTVTYNGIEMRDISSKIYESFESPLITLSYIGFSIAIWFHTKGALKKAFCSISIFDKSETITLNWIDRFYSWSISLGYALVPIACHFKLGKAP